MIMPQLPSWLRISLLLCTFGFFREMRPSEPFVTEFLTSDFRNFTAEQINQVVYPFGTYAILAQLVIVFLITDIVRYKPIIVLSACAGIALFAILLWTRTMFELLIGQALYGTFMASEVAYYTYIYAKVEKSRYQIVTGHTRSAILCGKFLGGFLAQLLVSTNTMDYRELHYITFGSQIVSLFVALALPSVRQSLYFYTVDNAGGGGVVTLELEANEENAKTPIELAPNNVACKSLQQLNNDVKPSEENSSATATATSPIAPKFSLRNALRLLWQHTVSAYTNSTVIKWSCWWALATCGQLQVISYVQFLWKEIDETNISYYNGAVEATVTLLSAVGAMAAGYMNSARHKQWHMWILTIGSLLMGAFLIISAVTNLVLISYVMYILFGIVYFFVITIATATVAENLSDDSFGLIFGINTLIALALQSILTIVVVTDSGYGLGARGQFVVYGWYFVALAVLYCMAIVVRFLTRNAKFILSK